MDQTSISNPSPAVRAVRAVSLCRKNVTTYFNHYVKNIAATDPAAIALAGISAADLKAIKDGFMLNSEVRAATTGPW